MRIDCVKTHGMLYFVFITTKSNILITKRPIVKLWAMLLSWLGFTDFFRHFLFCMYQIFFPSYLFIRRTAHREKRQSILCHLNCESGFANFYRAIIETVIRCLYYIMPLASQQPNILWWSQRHELTSCVQTGCSALHFWDNWVGYYENCVSRRTSGHFQVSIPKFVQ